MLIYNRNVSDVKHTNTSQLYTHHSALYLTHILHTVCMQFIASQLSNIFFASCSDHNQFLLSASCPACCHSLTSAVTEVSCGHAATCPTYGTEVASLASSLAARQRSECAHDLSSNTQSPAFDLVNSKSTYNLVTGVLGLTAVPF